MRSRLARGDAAPCLSRYGCASPPFHLRALARDHATMTAVHAARLLFRRSQDARLMTSSRVFFVKRSSRGLRAVAAGASSPPWRSGYCFLGEGVSGAPRQGGGREIERFLTVAVRWVASWAWVERGEECGWQAMRPRWGAATLPPPSLPYDRHHCPWPRPAGESGQLGQRFATGGEPRWPGDGA